MAIVATATISMAEPLLSMGLMGEGMEASRTFGSPPPAEHHSKWDEGRVGGRANCGCRRLCHQPQDLASQGEGGNKLRRR